MSPILFRLDRPVKRQVQKIHRKTRDNTLALRCQVILLAAQDHYRVDIAVATGFSVSWVQRILRRFRQRGIMALYDGREDNGEVKTDALFLHELYMTVDGSPQDYGYPRPTWTLELLCKVMHKRTGVKVSSATMSRALAEIGARHGRPKPTVSCPWKKSARTRRQRLLQRLVQGLPEDEVLYYEDEVDIHLKVDMAETDPRTNITRCTRPAQELVDDYMGRLEANWPAITGSTLASVTRPVAFTGRKWRRLLVLADGTATPPWGT